MFAKVSWAMVFKKKDEEQLKTAVVESLNVPQVNHPVPYSSPDKCIVGFIGYNTACDRPLP